MSEQKVSVRELAEALGIARQVADRKLAGIACTTVAVRGGREKRYALSDLPADLCAAYLAKSSVSPSAPFTSLSATEFCSGVSAPEISSAAFSYNPEELWAWAATRTAKLREQGARRAQLLMQVMHLMRTGNTFAQAAAAVAIANGISSANLVNWYYGRNGRPGARHYNTQDWAAALIPGYAGRSTEAEISPSAWDWFLGHYLTRRQPSLADSYRRTREVAKAKGWTVASERTFQRRLEAEVSAATRVYLREGREALAQLYPPQRRDKTVFDAGEAAVGDGLKFDKLWIRWPDGEILNTSTGWFWSDVRTNKFLAYRLAKTENTDLFRLATYDLTAVCLPRYVWVDNTVVAANKAMTGRAPGRHRFHDRADDAIGLLLQLGMEPRFTLPDMEKSNPGAKPVERNFGIGGIHSEVVTNPQFLNRGYSKETAVPYEEFARVVADEVARFNARPKRRTPVCRGVLSFDEAFAESFSKATVRCATQAQRDLLLLMPEVVTASSERGEIRLKAGRSPHGAHRYWTEALAEFKGHQLVAYYDPQALTKPIAVYTLDGRFVCKADHLGDVGFNDTQTGREWLKNKQRQQKAWKQAAAAERRMSDLELAALYPQPEAPAEVPPPGVVQGNFGQKRKVVNGEMVDTDTGEVIETGRVMSVEQQDGLRAYTEERLEWIRANVIDER